MLKTERENRILKVLEQNGYVTVKTLSEMLFASESSIRRDLSALEDAGLINRNYGGAELQNRSGYVLPFGTRAHNNIKEKREIAVKAAALINEGDVVFLDASSTCYFLGLEIADRTDITVVTNSVELLGLLSQGKAAVHSTGGVLSGDNRICLVGRNAEKGFEEIYADIAFFSVKSLDLDGRVSDCSQEENFVRRAMLKNAAKKVLLINGGKLKSRSSFGLCHLSELDALVCDTDIPPEFSNYCEII